MNRGQRYEPVPQRDEQHEEPIILAPIPNYNYNTGIPSSIASSQAPSVVSIPNSPPPSFHTHSSPGTPRPSQAQINLHDHVFNNGGPACLRGGGGGSATEAELWGIAPSTVGGDTLDGMASTAELLSTIKVLQQRIDFFQESMGRLLLERDKGWAKNSEGDGNTRQRDNCCVSFTDASPDLERAFISTQGSRGQNCCVSFSGSHNSAVKRKERRVMLVAFIFVTFMICCTVAVIMTARAGRVNRAVNKAVDGVSKFLE